MQLKRLRAEGWLPFPGLIDINFETLNGEISAVTGPNGAGKSTLLELYAGALYRKTPTRGTLQKLATSRKAFVEVVVENGTGEAYTIRQTVDGSGDAETSLTDSQGRAVLTSGKVSEFKEWAKKHLPAPEVFFASLFTAQGSKGLLGMDPAERKAVILRVLGLERLEDLAERAREHRKGVAGKLGEVLARVDEIAVLAEDDVAILRDLVVEVANNRNLTKQDLETKERELSSERDRAAAVAEELREFETLVARREDIAQQEHSLTLAIADLHNRLSNNRAIVVDAEAIRAAVDRTVELAGEIASLRESESELLVKQKELEGEIRSKRESGRRDAARRLELGKEIFRADTVLAVREAVAQAAIDAPGYDVTIQELQAAGDAAWQERESLAEQLAHGAETRIRDLRSALEKIADVDGYDREGVFPPDVAFEALAADTAQEKTLREIPARLAACEAQWRTLGSDCVAVRKKAEQTRILAGRLPEIERAQTARQEAEEALRAIAGREDTLSDDIVALERDLQETTGILGDIRTTIEDKTAERIRLEPLAAKAERLAQAEARIHELEEQETKAKKSLEDVYRLAQEVTSALAGRVEPKPVDLASIEADVADIRRTLSATETNLALREQDLARAEESLRRREELLVEARALEEQSADWLRLSQDLGRDGLQALEIDAAGPELTTLANDLLRACGDTRFSVSIETTRSDAKGKRDLETCEIRVLDSRTGLAKTSEQLSGGEAVFVGEAVSLSVAMLGIRRSGARRPTLVRDETGASLDPERAAQYIAMLRRAGDIVDASKILFVSHDPNSQALADSRIDVSRGAIAIH